MKKLSVKEWVAVGVAVAATIVLFFGGSVWSWATGGRADDASLSLSADEQRQDQVATTTLSDISTVQGVEIYDLKEGTGVAATMGTTVTTHYVGTLTNGAKFDSSRDRGTPYSFVLGGHRVIRGWEIGLEGMKVGGVRRLVISPEYAYGNQPIGQIPPNSTLIFDVELLGVQQPAR